MLFIYYNSIPPSRPVDPELTAGDITGLRLQENNSIIHKSCQLRCRVSVLNWVLIMGKYAQIMLLKVVASVKWLVRVNKNFSNVCYILPYFKTNLLY